MSNDRQCMFHGGEHTMCHGEGERCRACTVDPASAAFRVGAVPVEVPEDAVEAVARELYAQAVDDERYPWSESADQDEARRVARAVLAIADPLIAARVRAETQLQLVEPLLAHCHAAEANGFSEVPVSSIRAAITAAAVPDVADHDARVRAEERQRVAAMEWEAVLSKAVCGRRPSDTVAMAAAVREAIAAGSAVPVATPDLPATCPACGGQDRRCVHRFHSLAAPVATPTEPGYTYCRNGLHSIPAGSVCPSCDRALCDNLPLGGLPTER